MSTKTIIVYASTHHGNTKKQLEVIANQEDVDLVDIEANGYEPAESMFNIYHVSPHETQIPDEFVTEVCYPVKKK